MTDITSSKIYRNRELLNRQLFITDGSDDEKVKVRPEFKTVHDHLMRNQIRIDMDVKNVGNRFWGHDPLEEDIRAFISQYCNDKCKGFWTYTHKRYPVEEFDSSTGLATRSDSLAKWTFTIMFEFEDDLDAFMKDQALMVKLRY